MNHFTTSMPVTKSRVSGMRGQLRGLKLRRIAGGVNVNPADARQARYSRHLPHGSITRHPHRFLRSIFSAVKSAVDRLQVAAFLHVVMYMPFVFCSICCDFYGTN